MNHLVVSPRVVTAGAEHRYARAMTQETVLEPDPAEATEGLEAALEATGTERERALREVAARFPTSCEAWARLGEHAYESGDDVAAYAYFRVGYHRGLDRLRGAGWRGSGPAPWSHPSNRGFLRALHGLMVAAAAIGEGVEARRCREFLCDLDPDDHFRARGIRPAALSRRLEDR